MGDFTTAHDADVSRAHGTRSKPDEVFRSGEELPMRWDVTKCSLLEQRICDTKQIVTT